jgi:hypothetical protein
VVGFFSFYRKLLPATRKVLTEIADRFQNWVKDKAQRWGAPILDALTGAAGWFRRALLRGARPDQVVAIIKPREPARIMTAIGTAKDNR